MEKKVAILMGSDSDLSIVKGAITVLKGFGIPIEVHVMSAHRTPKVASSFAESARENGFAVIIAAAGKAAHLAGVIASHTTLPVIGLPCKSSTIDGLDSLLSTVQMPKGIPVATVAIDGAENAGILAAQIIGVFDDSVAEKLLKAKDDMVLDVMAKDEKLQTEMWWKM
jgi:5-(carboxyamino)imidazole ribonucleotide mutase